MKSITSSGICTPFAGFLLERRPVGPLLPLHPQALHAECRSRSGDLSRRSLFPQFRALDRGGSGTRTGERDMRDSAGRRDGLDLVVVLDALQSVPEAYTSAEQDRDHHDVQMVDEPGGKKVADHGGAPADAQVRAV